MHAIITKYVQIFCIAVFFDNVSCDQMPLREAKADYILIGETACTAACMTKQQERNFHVLDECYGNCSRSTTERMPTEDASVNYTMKLVCREDTTLTVEIMLNAIQNANNDSDHEEAHDFDGRLYVVKVQQDGKLHAGTFVYIADSPIIKIQQLTPDTKYNVTATVVTSNYLYSYVPDVAAHRTLRNDFLPNNITASDITYKYSVNPVNPQLMDLDVFWRPASDMTCTYEVIFHPIDDNKYYDFYTKRILDFKVTIPNITYETEYQVGVKGINPKYYSRQSVLLYKTIQTPPCLMLHKKNLSICAPHQILNLKIKHTRISQNAFNLNVTWDTPETKPDYYVVTFDGSNIDEHKVLNNSRSINVSGDSTFAYFDAITVLDMDNEITVAAYSAGGLTFEKQRFNFFQSYISFWEKYQSQLKIIYVLVLILIGVTIILVLFVILYRRIKRNHLKDEHLSKYQIKFHLRKLAPKHDFKKWAMLEVDANDVQLEEVLGEGAFGVVRRGRILSKRQDVAAKMLKGTATIVDYKGFLEEIVLMRSVGRHANIVGIIGHCTTEHTNMMLLTEYCSEGNLLNYLRNAYAELLAAHTEHKAKIKCKELQEQHAHIPGDRKSTEDLLNLNMSICDEKTTMTKNTLDSGSSDDNHHTTPKTAMVNGGANRPTVVVNRAYDYENNNAYLQKFVAHHSVPECRVEFVMNGLNDLKYSEEQRKRMVKTNTVQDVSDANGEKLQLMMMVENRGYDVLASPHTDESDLNQSKQSYQMECNSRHREKKPLTSSELLNFAKQISEGMEFLATSKIVHRDLAARNVLVCSDKTVKIADFGLSRDIYQNDIYHKSSDGKLPIKWLALESLPPKQEYTTYSDVWSYGILLYEIVTLGKSPYPLISLESLLEGLKAGKRMSRPTNCSEEFYRLMYSCWNSDASKRPRFAEITENLEYFLTNCNADELINVSCLETSERLSDAITRSVLDSSSSYLKPI